MRSTIFICAMSSFIFFQACNHSGSGARITDSLTKTDHTGIEDTISNTNTSTGSQTDQDFVIKAGLGNSAEVEAGNIAAQKATDDDVKAFAKLMVKHKQN